MAMFYSMSASGRFHLERGTNLLDGGAHFYDTYRTKDDEHICIGSIEPQFYALLIEKAGLDAEKFAPQMDESQWPELKAELTNVFLTKTRAQWCELMEGTDVCFAPVLNLEEAAEHPHSKARNSYLQVDGVLQHAPAPRFSRTKAGEVKGARVPGEDSRAVLQEFGFSDAEVGQLEGDQVIAKV
jgi:alpha-methylacyl-CoA racemase